MSENINYKHKDFLTNRVLQNIQSTLDKETITKLANIRREKTLNPIITISINSSSIVRKALEIKEKILEYIKERNLSTSLLETGSLGLYNYEPILSVHLPGKSTIFFKNISLENYITILDGAFNNFLNKENILGQKRNNVSEQWEHVPFLDELPFFKNQQRLILKDCGIIDPNSIEEYIANGGYKSFLKTIRNNTPSEICDIIKDSNLRGRGGEGYPTGQKWNIASETTSEQKYVICNAGESDPGAFMERLLIESNPHKIIEGIAIAAYATRAQKAYIYIESEYKLAVKRIKNAIRQAKDFELLGHDILNSGYNLDIIVKEGAGAYVCGEETALIKSIEGKRGRPHSKPPYPATKGLFNKPTVVNNVETLANIPIIIDKGHRWFANLGVNNSSGTKVFSISGKTKYQGVIEVEMGTKLHDIVYRIAGGIENGKTFKAIHIGGPSGGSLSEKHLNLTVDYNTIAEHGASLAAGIIVLDEDNCIVDTTKYFMNFLEKESCGLCIPCREGTRRLHEILQNISKQPKDENGYTTLQRFKGVMQLENLAEVIKDTSMCGLGRKAANPVLSSLKWFRDEYEEHIFERNCHAGVCQELRTYEIDVDTCTGCTICAKRCPNGAIIGSIQQAHFIVQDKCSRCGICYEVCKFSAIKNN